MPSPSRRAPTQAAVDRAADVLARAAMAEAERIRKEYGHSGHQGAQELEHLAFTITGLASRLKQSRARR